MKTTTNTYVRIACVLFFGVLLFLVTRDNFLARQWGGEQEIHLPPDKKLVNAAWKNNSLWMLVRPMKTQEVPEVYDFIENSNLEILEGTVHIIEHKGGVQ